MYQFQEEEERRHLSADRVYDSLEDLLISGKKKRDQSPTRLKNSHWLSKLPYGYILAYNDGDKASLYIPADEEVFSTLKLVEDDLFVDGLDLRVIKGNASYHNLAYSGYALDLVIFDCYVVKSGVEDNESKSDRDLRNLEAVRSAWCNTGRAPRYHYKMQNKLRKEWPVLAAALDRL